jgi:hypothetical protein
VLETAFGKAPKGSLIQSIIGLSASGMSNAQIADALQIPNAVVEYLHTEPLIYKDAKNYSDTYDALSQFTICCVCGIEDSPCLIEHLEPGKFMAALSRLKAYYVIQIAELKNPDSENYDHCYAAVLQEQLPNGLLPSAKQFCKYCSRAFSKNNLPDRALIQGLFSGAIPEELRGFNLVEQSMILIYSLYVSWQRLPRERSNNVHHRQ